MDRVVTARDTRPSWLGFWSGPLLWFAQQQALFWSLGPSCHRPWIAPTLALAFVLLLVGAGFYAWQRGAAALALPDPLAPAVVHFVYRLGILSPSVFAVAVIWQTLATLSYDACLR